MVPSACSYMLVKTAIPMRLTDLHSSPAMDRMHKPLQLKSSASITMDLWLMAASHFHSRTYMLWTHAEQSLASSTIEFPMTYSLRQLSLSYTTECTCLQLWQTTPASACCWDTNTSAPSQILHCDKNLVR